MNTLNTFSQAKRTIRAGRASAKLEWTTRQHLFLQILEALFTGQEDLVKLLMRDLINGSIGFESLANKIGVPSKSLHRMLSKNGNPTSKNLLLILRELRKADGFEIQVQVIKRANPSGV